MIVAVDEARHDRHLLGIIHLRALARDRPHFRRAPHRNEAVTLDSKRLRPRISRIDGINLRVKDDQIRFQPCRGCRAYRLCSERTGYASSQ